MSAEDGEHADVSLAAPPDGLDDRAPCGYLSATPDGTIVAANQALLTLVGYRRDDLVGRMRFADLLSPGGKIYHETHYAPMLRMQGSAREIALDLVRVDGERVPVLVNSVLERGADGQPVVVRTAVFEARQRRDYERELLRAKERAEVSEARAKALARTLQQTLIPPTPPAVPGLDIAAGYRPAGDGSEVGGDFYDVVQARDGDWLVAIGDVCGKGAEAAVVTALARHTLRDAVMRDASPSSALEVLNTVLRGDLADRSCTVALLRLRHRADGWRATISSAGHPLPLRRSAAGVLVALGEPGSLLGVFDHLGVVEVAVSLAPGDLVVMYTDGVPDGRRGREFYGEERLDALLAGLDGTASEVVDALLDDVLRFQHGVARDDIAIVSLRVPPLDAPPCGTPPRRDDGAA